METSGKTDPVSCYPIEGFVRFLSMKFFTWLVETEGHLWTNLLTKALEFCEPSVIYVLHIPLKTSEIKNIIFSSNIQFLNCHTSFRHYDISFLI